MVFASLSLMAFRRLRGDTTGAYSTRRSESGFTLIELLAVVGIIATVSAIAVPGLMRARMSGSEASAIGSLRAISSSQSAFAASCGSGFYAPSLEILGTPPAVGETGYIGTDLNADPSFKSSYEMSVTPGALASGAPPSCNGAPAGTVVATYFAAAMPAATGFRFFGTNQAGVIYQDRVAVAVTQSGAPAGASPIQ